MLSVWEENMFDMVTRRSLAALGLAAILAPPMAWSQDAPPVRVRGTIERMFFWHEREVPICISNVG
jgi:hypothetical protein